MTQQKALTKTQKGRIFSFMAIVLLLLYLILTFAWYVRGLTDLIPYTDSCNIDGSDFSPVANFCVAGFNGIMNLLVTMLFIGITWIVTLVSLLIWRFTAIRKTSEIAALECKIATYTWLIFIAGSLIGCLSFLQFSHLTFCTFLIGLPILLLWLLGVLPIKNRYSKQNETDIEA